MIEIFTDGSSRGNPGPGGFGVILKSGEHYKELSAGYLKTTNNRMELLGVIIAIEAIKNAGQDIKIYSDSKYVIDPIEKGWLNSWKKINFKNKKNPDLWQRLIPLLEKHKIKFIWVRGHDGHHENERCDELAVMAATGSGLKVDLGYDG